jgi:hypothetical protein
VKYTLRHFAQVLTLLPCVLEASGSNLDQDNDCPDLLNRHSIMLSVIHKFINILLKWGGGCGEKIIL